jgi:hypothetical protein
MSYKLGNIQNPVYYSFQAEDRMYVDDIVLVGKMLSRLVKLHRSGVYKVEVYDNQAGGKPKLFEFTKEELT